MLQYLPLVLIILGILVFLVGFAFVARYLRLWVQSYASSAGIGLFDLVAMSFKKVNPTVIVRSKIMAVQAGLGDSSGVTRQALEAHYLAGGRVPLVVQALIAARMAQIEEPDFKLPAAIDLAGIVGNVTLLEFDAKLRADEVLQRKLRSLANVEVRRMAQTTTVRGDGSKVVGLTYRDRESGAEHQLDVAGIFVQIGLLPNTDWIKGTVALSKHDEIEVDTKGQTSVPGVFAAGDVTTVPYKQIIIAMGEGAKASLGAFDYLIRHSAPSAQAAPETLPLAA